MECRCLVNRTECPVHGGRRGLLVDNDPDLIPPAPQQSWCFTFGCGSPLARYYVEIDAEDEYQARCRMVAMFSRHWASVYPREGFDRQVEQYGLLRLDVNKNGSVRLGTNDEEIPRDVYNRAFPW